MTSPEIRIQGLGLTTSVGRGLPALVEGLRAQTVTPVLVPRSVGDGAFPFRPVQDGNAGDRLYDRIAAVVTDAIADAALTPAEVAELGIFLGTSSVDIALREQEFVRRLEGHAAPQDVQWGIGQMAARVARAFGIRGPQYTFTTACSSSANALIYAARLLRHGRIPRALVIGTEHFNRVTLHGFDGMLLLSKQTMRPFDARRDGMILGEGTGALILGPEPARNGSLPNAKYHGGATLIDPQGITCSTPERTAEVMTAALNDAHLAPGDIRAVKAHGVSTPAGDRSEGQGLRHVFGASLPPITAFKPVLGHTLGACAVLEAAGFLGCVQAGFLPATPGYETADPAVGCEPLRKARPAETGAYLLNHFGFGGNNTALVLSVGP